MGLSIGDGSPDDICLGDPVISVAVSAAIVLRGRGAVALTVISAKSILARRRCRANLVADLTLVDTVNKHVCQCLRPHLRRIQMGVEQIRNNLHY
jgi:hypothetical protein